MRPPHSGCGVHSAATARIRALYHCPAPRCVCTSLRLFCLCSLRSCSFAAAPVSHAVFHSADYVNLIAAYLHINELIQASALCRAMHPLFECKAVWQGRLREAERIQHVDADHATHDVSVLSPAQSAALPPLPSLSETAALCLQAYWPKSLLSEFPAVSHPRVTAIVPCRPPSHATSGSSFYLQVSQELRGSLSTWRISLKYSEQQQQWTVEHMGLERFSGWRVDDNMLNIGLDDPSSDGQPHRPVIPRTTTVYSSYKRRYIDSLKCSEHEHNHCYRLLHPHLLSSLTPTRMEPTGQYLVSAHYLFVSHVAH